MDVIDLFSDEAGDLMEEVYCSGSPHNFMHSSSTTIYGQDAIAVVTTLCNGVSTTSSPSLSVPVLQSCLERVT